MGWIVSKGILDSKANILVLWGCFDVVYISWLVQESIKAGKVPYYSDFVSMLSHLASYGGSEAYAFAVVDVLLEASIFVSAGMLLTRHPKAILICWFQMPFRLLLSTPSISVIPILLGFFDSYSIVVAFALIVLSEFVKAYTLWRVSNG